MAPSSLLMTMETSAKFDLAWPSEPVKIMSSVFFPRRSLTDCSPRHQRTASARLDFPEPFGPTMTVRV